MGFMELVVIAIVGLLVIGPEKLPHTIKVGVVWFTRIKNAITNTRNEIEQQIGIDELKRELRNEQIMQSLHERHPQLSPGRGSRSAEDIVSEVDQRLSQMRQDDARIEQHHLSGEDKAVDYPQPTASPTNDPHTPPSDDKKAD